MYKLVYHDIYIKTFSLKHSEKKNWYNNNHYNMWLDYKVSQVALYDRSNVIH